MLHRDGINKIYISIIFQAAGRSTKKNLQLREYFLYTE